MRLHMDKKLLIRAQKIIQGAEKKQSVILAEPQVLRQWDDVRCYTDHHSGYKYTFTFDGAEDVLVVKFANEQDIKQWDVYIRKPCGLRGYQKMQRISARKEHVSMDRTEICDGSQTDTDNALWAENSSYTNTLKSNQKLIDYYLFSTNTLGR